MDINVFSLLIKSKAVILLVFFWLRCHFVVGMLVKPYQSISISLSLSFQVSVNVTIIKIMYLTTVAIREE
jgi:hypothetical protein